MSMKTDVQHWYCDNDPPEADGMRACDRAKVRKRVDSEGFDYCFRDYSTFPEIKDAKFHLLRKAYIDAANALEKYACPEDKDDDL